ncbi:hypothetical protein NLJ89_g12064 [Agrocybe chaxingu]|uniref:Uncharacterized protein n=1 Tax=Agrocybe chaxingu TaxID=84603 RepID=A0A9W8JR85_9AGAR|nr:hypothetical protein NLJ89_g12064 [Agrocybe chaxingu]
MLGPHSLRSNSNSAGDDDQVYTLDDVIDFVESGGVSSVNTGSANTNPNTGGPALTLTSSGVAGDRSSGMTSIVAGIPSDGGPALTLTSSRANFFGNAITNAVVDPSGVAVTGSGEIPDIGETPDVLLVIGSPLGTRAFPVVANGPQVQPGNLISASASGASSGTLNTITGIDSNSISSVIDSDTTSIVTGTAADIVSNISGSANDVDVLPLGSSIATSASGAIAGIARAESASSGIINAAGSRRSERFWIRSSSSASSSASSSSGGGSSSSASSAASSSPGSASSASASSGSSGNVASVSGAGAVSGTLNTVTGEVLGAATSIGGSGGLSLSSKSGVDPASISLDNAAGTINLSDLLPSNLAEAAADLLDRLTGQLSNADLDLLKDIIASLVNLIANGDAAIVTGQLISDAPTTANPANPIQTPLS